MLAVGEVDPHVGALGALVGLRGDLQVEVAALDHAGQSGDVLERGLAPRPAHLRLAQGVDQGGGLAAHGLAGVAHGADLGPHLGRDLDALLLDVGEPGLELLEARGHRGEQLLGRLHPLLRRRVDRPALLLGDLVGEEPELLDHRLPAGLDLLRTRHGRITLGERHGDIGLGPRGGHAGVGELLVQLGELARVDARRLAATHQHADPAAGGEGEEDEQCGGHGGIVAQTTDRTPDHTPGTPANDGHIAYPAGYGPPRPPAVLRRGGDPGRRCRARAGARRPHPRSPTVTAFTEDGDTVVISCDTADDAMTMSCVADLADVNGVAPRAEPGLRGRAVRRRRRRRRDGHRQPRRPDDAGVPGAEGDLGGRRGCRGRLRHRQRGARRRARRRGRRRVHRTRRRLGPGGRQRQRGAGRRHAARHPRRGAGRPRRRPDHLHGCGSLRRRRGLRPPRHRLLDVHQPGRGRVHDHRHLDQRLDRHRQHRELRPHGVRRREGGQRRRPRPTAAASPSTPGPATTRSWAGPGADLADMGAGNDSVDAGPGSDFVLAGDGDDWIMARDGFGDVVECGPGNDTVVADRSDVLSGCENVVLPAPETSRIDGPRKVGRAPRPTSCSARQCRARPSSARSTPARSRSCASPFKVKTRKLKTGWHTLTVRAVQPAGNPDATPSTFPFKVKHKAKKHRPSSSGTSTRARLTRSGPCAPVR